MQVISVWQQKFMLQPMGGHYHKGSKNFTLAYHQYKNFWTQFRVISPMSYITQSLRTVLIHINRPLKYEETNLCLSLPLQYRSYMKNSCKYHTKQPITLVYVKH